MNAKSGLQAQKATPKPTFSLSQPGILQRQCDCGGVPGLTGECEECSSKRLSGQRRATTPPETLSNSPDAQPTAQLQRTTRGGYSFANLAIKPQERLAVQTKLAIGQPGDQYEQQADRIADRVMRMPEPSIQRQMEPEEEEEEGMVQKEAITNQITPLVQRQVLPDIEEEEEEVIQTKTIDNQAAPSAPTQESSEVPSIVHEVLRAPGQPLDPEDRAFMEPRFGHDFSRVRVHSGGAAERSAQEVNARAYTVGHNIVFGAGRFAPRTHEGRRLIAHELTHVVQQGSAKNNSPAQLPIQKNSGHQVMRSLALDSTVKICRRELTSRNIKVSQGGLRVVLLLNQLDTGIPDCQNHKFGVTLTKSVDWGFDDEIATCEGETGGDRSFSFGNLSSGTYYLTIARSFDHPYCCIEGDILVFDEPIRGDSSGCERDKDPSVMDIVHGALGIAGFIPVLGAIPDGINAVIYVAEGDWVNAGISAFAMIPAIGDGAKAAVMGGKAAVKVSEKTAIKLGEEGLVKAFKEAKAASKLEKEVAGQLEKEAAEKLEKEAAEKLEKEAAEKLEKEAAEKALKKKIAECEAIYAAYELLKNCRSCKASDTRTERAAKIACLTALLAGREKYLKEKCDYVLAGSIARGSAIAERGHQIQANQVAKMLEKCSTLPTS